MATIKAQKIPQRTTAPEDLIATFCYYFPQYTFSQARKMPYKRINQMLKAVAKEQAKQMLIMLRVVSAPHSKDGGKSISQDLTAIIDS